jgi:hypothetical protein
MNQILSQVKLWHSEPLSPIKLRDWLKASRMFLMSLDSSCVPFIGGWTFWRQCMADRERTLVYGCTTNVSLLPTWLNWIWFEVNTLPSCPQAFKYLFDINDNEQFPCACVGDCTDTYLMGQTTSSTVEGMNRVCKPARDKTAVDPVNTSLLIIAMMIDQFKFKRNQELAWKC